MQTLVEIGPSNASQGQHRRKYTYRYIHTIGVNQFGSVNTNTNSYYDHFLQNDECQCNAILKHDIIFIFLDNETYLLY